MLPSSTVENYLKTIYLSQAALPSGHFLVPMGQIASALGVAPGTATTMIKALAESGLVQYEPYSGVRLSQAGEKLAAMVSRRHRLVELFLVEVMGMSWAEVHDEAEKLEHVVSERLIERIDEMLGHPKADPHGDPIPGPEGTVKQEELQSLLTCPLHTPVTVMRVADQEAEFLRFIEHSNLKPGQSIEVEARDAASDSVRVRGKDDQRITIGTRAASKLLVHVLQSIALLFAWAAAALAQPAAPLAGQSGPPGASSRPFEILDNSFLLEEAFNQERGIFQNILSFIRSRDAGWQTTFTQEWPLGGQTHQFSYTLPFSGYGGESGVADLLINYRYQALTERPGRPAFAPRLSIILPSGDEDRGLGNGVVGFQVNLPFSKQFGDLYTHGNAGFTHLPGVDAEVAPVSGRVVHELNLTTPHLAGSAIWRVRPMVNLMFEAVAEFQELLASDGSSERETVITLSPGIRRGWDVGEKQIVIGLAMPVSLSESNDEIAFLAYFSYELPFKR